MGHSLLTQRLWGHVDVAQLVERSIAKYHDADRGKQAHWSSTRLSLPPNMVVPLSMVLHELSTNAAKYVAFSVEHGRVNFTWRTDDGKVRFSWILTNVPPFVVEIYACFAPTTIPLLVSLSILV